MKSILGILIFLTSVLAGAQQIPTNRTGLQTEVSLTNQERFARVGSTKESLQDSFTLSASFDLNGVVTVHSLVQTGNTYSGAYNTLYDFKKRSFNSLDSDSKLYLKQVYLSKVMASGHLTLSAGAMSTGDPVGLANAMASNGWVDGARGVVSTSIGSMVVTAGQIKISDPDSVQRLEDFSANYFEITLKRKLMDQVWVEAGVTRLNGISYLESATRYDLQVAAQKIIHLMGEAKVETDNGAYKIGFGLQDLLGLFSTKVSDVKLALNYEYVSNAYNADMRRLSSGMHSGYQGSAIVTTVQYPISKQYGISGFTSSRVGEHSSDFRFESGIAKTIFKRKFGKQRAAESAEVFTFRGE